VVSRLHIVLAVPVLALLVSIFVLVYLSVTWRIVTFSSYVTLAYISTLESHIITGEGGAFPLFKGRQQLGLGFVVVGHGKKMMVFKHAVSSIEYTKKPKEGGARYHFWVGITVGGSHPLLISYVTFTGRYI
jgi:hypothetical protein